MAWRFKVSKFKNASAVLSKKEDWISDIKVGAPTSCGNHIKASAAFIAFNVENRGGGSLGLTPIDYKGRLDSSSPLLHGHSDLITDFDFSPFDDGLLATGSSDAHVRVWHISSGGLIDSLTEPEYSLPQFDKRIENVMFHPTVDYLLTIAYFDTVKLWDIKHEKEIYYFGNHEDQVQSCTWKGNGSLLATTAKDKTIRILDPRSKIVAHKAENHKSPKDSRVIWLGDSDKVLSTGFDSHRTREVRMRDLRNFNNPYKIQIFDSSTGILIPLYDADTSMLFLAGKADVTIMYWEVSEKDPFLIEGLKHNGYLQTKGACLVPKRGLNVMSGEVNRILQLTANAVVPLSYQVPRKSYREFHADLFPDTHGYNPSMSILQWQNGFNTPLKKLSLDPDKTQGPNLQMIREPLSKRKEEEIRSEQEIPIPAPRTFLSNGVNRDAAKISSTIGFCKPFVAVKPSFMPVKAYSAPKPASRSAFSPHENKNLIQMEKGEIEAEDQPSNNFAYIKKNFEEPTFKSQNVDPLDNKYTEDLLECFHREGSFSEIKRQFEDKKDSVGETVEETTLKMPHISKKNTSTEDSEMKTNRMTFEKKICPTQDSSSILNTFHSLIDFDGQNTFDSSQDPIIGSDLDKIFYHKTITAKDPCFEEKKATHIEDANSFFDTDIPRTFDELIITPEDADMPKTWDQGKITPNQESIFDLHNTFTEKKSTCAQDDNFWFFDSIIENKKKTPIQDPNLFDIEMEKNFSKTRIPSAQDTGSLLDIDLGKAFDISTQDSEIDFSYGWEKNFDSKATQDPNIFFSNDNQKTFDLPSITEDSDAICHSDNQRTLDSLKMTSSQESNLLLFDSFTENAVEKKITPTQDLDSLIINQWKSLNVNELDQKSLHDKENQAPLLQDSGTLYDISVSAAERRRNFEQQISSSEEKQSSPTPRRATGGKRSFRRMCKFRHLVGTPSHKSCNIDNLRDLNRTIPGECDGFIANAEFAVMPLCGPGGKLSVIRHTVAGRLPDGVIPSFVNGTSALDFAFDPFDDHCVAAGCDDGKIRLWGIPEGGLKKPTNEPYDILWDSSEKVMILKWHPLSSGVLATACGDFLVRIWDIASQRVPIVLEGHSDQVFSLDWSPCGRFLASVSRDGKIRIFDPRKSCNPTQEGAGPVGVRGARVLWVLDGRYLVVCGFGKLSERLILIYKSNDLGKILNTVNVDVNPAILIPHYDVDSSTLFLAGKGDTTIYTYEVGSDPPYLFPLSHHKSSSAHQGFKLLPKHLCDVRQVEFSRGLRVSQGTMEFISFTVPRVKTELFQDDIFPPTQVTWEPVMTSAEWFGGTNRPPKLLSLQPPDMVSLSETRDGNSPPSSSKNSNCDADGVALPPRNHTPTFLKGMVPSEVKETQHRLEMSMNRQLNTVATSKDQDNMEGVDATEWDD